MSHPTRPARDLTPGDLVEIGGRMATVLHVVPSGGDVQVSGVLRHGARTTRTVPARRRFTLYGSDPSVVARAARAAARTAQEEASARRWQEART